jgi:hypothetical protein
MRLNRSRFFLGLFAPFQVTRELIRDSVTVRARTIRIGTVGVGTIGVGAIRVGTIRVSTVCISPIRIGPIRIGPIRIRTISKGTIRVSAIRIGTIGVSTIRTGAIAVSANHGAYLRRVRRGAAIDVARARLRRLESLGGHDRADAAVGRDVEKSRGDDNRCGRDAGTDPHDTPREETLICAHFIVP